MTHRARDRASLPLPLLRRGKVREVYEVDAERLLLVASDRVSAFDVVMREPVPHKGAVLTQLTAWWFEQLGGRGPVTTASPPTPTRSSRAVPALARPSRRARGPRDARAADRRRCRSSASCAAISPARRGRSTATTARWPASRCRRACVESDAARAAALLARPPRRRPGTTRTSPFDAHGARRSAPTLADRLRDAELRASTRAGRDHAAARGIIIADTKFEFGIDRGRHACCLIDEVLTPD